MGDLTCDIQHAYPSDLATDHGLGDLVFTLGKFRPFSSYDFSVCENAHW